MAANYPERTVIGHDVVITGTIKARTAGAHLIVFGEFNGNISMPDGTLEVGEGGFVNPESSIDCRQLVVAGTIKGASTKIRTNVFNLQTTGVVAVDLLCVPPGGLQQAQGSMSARLEMASDHALPSAEVSRPRAVQEPAIAHSTASPLTGFSFSSAPDPVPEERSSRVLPLRQG